MVLNVFDQRIIDFSFGVSEQVGHEVLSLLVEKLSDNVQKVTTENRGEHWLLRVVDLDEWREIVIKAFRIWSRHLLCRTRRGPAGHMVDFFELIQLVLVYQALRLLTFAIGGNK